MNLVLVIQYGNQMSCLQTLLVLMTRLPDRVLPIRVMMTFGQLLRRPREEPDGQTRTNRDGHSI